MKHVFFFVAGLLLSVALCAQPKYIFYFIGDGMGCNQVLIAEMFLAEMQGRIGTEQISFAKFPYSGQLSTYSASRGITDSSAAGTCLASGHKTTNHFLGVAPDSTEITSIAAKLHDAGWAVGVSSTVAIDNATPAAFYGHAVSRSDYYTIGCQLSKSGYEYFGGGGFVTPVSKTDSTLPNVYDVTEKAGYKIIRGYENFEEGYDKVMLIQRHEGVPITKSSDYIHHAIERKEGDMTMSQIVDAGIRQLKKHDRFFLMCESGSIDWTGHNNDAATNVREVIDFGQAVQVAVDFYLQHPDETLIIVTADHETGGMTVGAKGSSSLNFKLLANQKVSSGTLNSKLRELHKQYGKKLQWSQVQDLFRENLGFYDQVEISDEEEAKLQELFQQMLKGKGKTIKTLYSEIGELSKTAISLLNKKAHVSWVTSGHTASPVPIFSIGVGAEQFAGWHDNSEVAPTILRLAGVE